MRYVIFLLFLATPALAQEVPVELVIESEPPWLPMLLAAIAVLIPSLLNTFVSSDSWYGQIITKLALAVGKAKVNPEDQ